MPEETKDEIKIGQEVFIINKDVEIESKKIMAIINEEDKVKFWRLIWRKFRKWLT